MSHSFTISPSMLFYIYIVNLGLIMNKKLKYIIGLLSIGLLSPVIYADVAVKGYYRKDGTYVRPHMRSDPDGNFNNNWSSYGNVNPYTGEIGTKKAPDSSYRPNSSPNSPSTITAPAPSFSPQINHSDNGMATPQGSPSKLFDKPVYSSIYYGQNINSTVRMNNASWKLIAKDNSNATYIKLGQVEYYGDGLPMASLMFSGVMKANEKPTWLGQRFVKVKVNCATRNLALVADAVVNSQGNIIKNDVVREGQAVTWYKISDLFDENRFLSNSRVCLN